MNITYTLDQIDQAAKFVLDHSTSKIILFEGEMGSGKTTLIKSLIKELGSKDIVSSPTFSLVNEYTTNNNPIFHFDLYRVEDEEELYNFGIETYIYSNNYVLVEWPEILKNLIQDNFTIVKISLTDANKRTLSLHNN
ncbi:tRNA (adenosine(37)-N6)-threonylcarbamoyltransferase complex ATPase subunit type 1 TsaE [Mesoflavibacter profundi]|uniref:tRNA threonylcarbamoyladenosine biosynthesis protein TsaE n=1 Tax=Mesoflavibacter profundi TaxID=2708110 RepID=A0ABT4RXV5_9FLAO|nr:tRNA (adenosine(37)-N6)-threonylcarbamoyltransferase complex ATPase subunit type 1 TsaE [Mesoflavibacter profundi]MDA0176648.1 tRNA (adenosine(37)-N6)-threonylcarbamoyltransferase complex ATPase subunit type 1 TsaE [Mesoflavibacter profundi]